MEIALDRHRPGHENMAIDRALLARGTPTVRLYGWEPGCVSLGYTQSPADVNERAARERGFDIVERPTGGGAIFHAPTELTYAVVLPTDHPRLSPDLFESYELLSAGVVGALRELGLDAQYRKAAGGKDAFCYVREAGVSIVVGGRKVSGGAQRRTRTAVLQHGTVLVESDPELLALLFHEDPARVRRNVGSLADLGVSVPRDELVQLVAAHFRTALGLQPAPTTGPEACDQLVRAPLAP